MSRVNVCLVCTGPYRHYLPAFLASAEKFFLHDAVYHVFSDVPVERDEQVVNHYWPHLPWPFPTLRRYQAMLSAWHDLKDCHCIYYMDVDMRFVAPVGTEIFGELVAVKHHGYHFRQPHEMPFERRLESTSCTLNGEMYYAGAVQGGEPSRWHEAMVEMNQMINTDWHNGVVPAQHDESVWNRALSKHRPTLELPPTYCWHQPHPIHRPYALYDPIDPPKIVALFKEQNNS